MRTAFILAKVAVCLAAALPLPVFAGDGCAPQAPCYTAAGIVNSASGAAEDLAPYTFVTIYGTNLSFDTRDRAAGDPTPSLRSVQVIVSNIPALVTYVSPGQINALIPYSLKSNQDVWIQVVRSGVYGPQVPIRLHEFAPEFFQDGPDHPVAQHDDFTYIKPDSPGRPGGYAILYLTGLGRTQLPAEDYSSFSRPIRIEARSDLQVLLDGQPVDDSLIEYAGVVPTVPGLYQINLKLPANAGPNPAIRVLIRGALSREGLSLPVAAAGAQ